MPESCSLTITCLDGWDGQIDEDGQGHTHTQLSPEGLLSDDYLFGWGHTHTKHTF